MDRFDITPQASYGRIIDDRDWPMLACQWLVEGYDSPLLRELAALTPQQALAGEVPLEEVLAELGFPVREIHFPYDQLPWRGQWEWIWWVVGRMDRTQTPYETAHDIAEVIGDHDELWEPGGGDRLMALLRAWEDQPAARAAIDQQIRQHLRGLREEQVPPLDPTD